MSSIKKLNESGALDVFIIPLILMTLLFLGVSGFALWAYAGQQDYKKNVDDKVAAALQIAEKDIEAKKAGEFAEKEKLPLKEYQGPAAYNSVIVKYPKTWSAYVDERSNNSEPVNAYFHPVYVPAIDSTVSYALRVQVVNRNYAAEVQALDSQVKSGKLRAQPYVPAKVQTITGLRVDGEIVSQKTGTMIILPVRDKTLKIWTETDKFVGDFNDIILPNYSFAP